MRTLPKNISAHPDGFLVRVVRKGIRYQAFVPKSFASGALAEATRLRDRFLLIHGAIAGRGPSRKAYSNTGLVGVSETVHWSHQRPHPCFLVSAAPNFRRRIYFGAHRPRAAALQMAVSLRMEKVSREVTKAAKENRTSPPSPRRGTSLEVTCQH